ncbi:D-hexose-6-phosphate mutarotase [Erwinia sp. CPCC 100877]|nr:D-hexose-6-phosphate mutarotase [Erwinia sp. CPCC 100877]
MSADIYALSVVNQLSDAVSRRSLGELDLIVVDHPAARAAFALQGAHLLSWQPAGEEEVIWLSSNTPFSTGSALRGGVPICWPWFGPSAQQGFPSHGFARNLPWQLKEHRQDIHGVSLTFELMSGEETRRFWPYDFQLLAHFRLGAECEMVLEAHGDFETTAALHSYFRVGDIAQVRVTGLGERYIDKVNNGEEGTLVDGVQTFPDRTDRVYLAPEAVSRIEDGKLGRTIEVVHHFNSNVVGWNPGPALSASMSDMPDDGYRTMVCVETASVTVPQHARPGHPSRLACTLKVLKG